MPGKIENYLLGCGGKKKKTKIKDILNKLVSRENLACYTRNYKGLGVFLFVKISLNHFLQEHEVLGQ